MLDWDALEETCRQCRACELWRGRNSVVFGVGDRQANLMFIGEGPGQQEDLQGEPFVGRAGKLLDEMLAVIGLDRSKVYIANLVKCRPPQNRDPLPEETDACIGYLRNQVRLVRPKVLVCLGRLAAQRVIDKSFRITAQRGQWFSHGAYDMMATYHPAYLLRDPRKRPDAFADMLAIESKLQAP